MNFLSIIMHIVHVLLILNNRRSLLHIENEKKKYKKPSHEPSTGIAPKLLLMPLPEFFSGIH